MLLLLGRACAEEQAILDALELGELNQFALEQGVSLEDVLGRILSGETSLSENWSALADPVKRAAEEEIKGVGAALILPMAVLLTLKLALPGRAAARRTAGYVCRAASIAALSRAFVRMSGVAQGLMENLLRCSDLLTPAMITATTLSGAESTAAFLTPMSGVCANLIQNLLSRWGIALSAAAAGIAIAGNLAEGVRLKRLHGLFRQTLNWSAGLMMTAFMGILSIQGRLGGARDSAAARTTRYAIESIVPVIGGNVSESLESLLSTATIVKNALGASGLALLLCLCLVPLGRLGFSALFLKAVSAMAEPLGDDGMTALTAQFADAVEMLLVVCTAAAVLCALLVGSCMAAAGGILH